MKHPIFAAVTLQVESEFMQDPRFARKKRDPFEAAELKSHIETVTKWTAEETAKAIEAGNLSALNSVDDIALAVMARVTKQFAWYDRLNPWAKTAAKKAARATVHAAVAYLSARFPVLTLVNAGPALNIIRTIATGG